MIKLVVPRKPTSKAQTYRLTEEARVFLAALAARRGSDKTTYLEGLIRDEATRQGMSIEQARFIVLQKDHADA